MSDRNQPSGCKTQFDFNHKQMQPAPMAGAITHEEKVRRSRIVMRSRVDLLEAGILAGPFGEHVDRQWINGEITLAQRRAALHAQYFGAQADQAGLGRP